MKIIPIQAASGFNAPVKPINALAPRLGDATLSGLASLPPLSLYIHIPWCVKKCPYCDFNSHESRQEIPEKQYVQALIADLEQSVPHIYGRKIRSVFFGGGTPSLFSPESIDAILSAVRALTPLEYNAEITLEANPGTVDTAHFSGYKQAGVNRVSLGIQSFNADYLQALGRIHNGKQALQAAELALTIFERVNFDVMYGLPAQTLAHALQDAQQALSFSPQHVSFYHLTLEPNTAFYRTPPALPDDDASAEMQVRIEAMLAQGGYMHYETSAFCKPQGEAQHNLNYWQFGDYLGIGAGAHSKLSAHHGIVRQARYKHPNRYLQAMQQQPFAPTEAHENATQMPANPFVESTQHLAQAELGFEFMMNALRLTEGVALSLFKARTGLPIETLAAQIKTAREQGLLEVSATHIKPTLHGQRFLNDLLQLFL